MRVDCVAEKYYVANFCRSQRGREIKGSWSDEETDKTSETSEGVDGTYLG
jgi:hypothetical protein